MSRQATAATERLVSESLVKSLEAVLMAADDGITRTRLIELLADIGPPSADEVDCALEALGARYADSAVALVALADGWQFQVRSDYSRVVAGLWEQKPPKPSRAMLETLALICYRQPITRSEIEQVRGVTVSSNIIRQLEQFEWIRVAGHRELPGRPALFATTQRFLADHGLASLDELPALPSMAEPEALDQAIADLAESTNVSTPKADDSADAKDS
ncbi:SMC-Scp complex subunit ScpB [Salinisphaera sp. USBA-960]|uniref:SMC-Scp complex subunit ScpB n=1 Tax=Salinisphaera orenii TaxID=856731 RepID=UPI000DBE9CAC|nr:SMC-Scp complex subunit ScpB [Salifodinibacter halophilus]NNC25644.1 SMC-Scp complex subunit ScpB [Salifodinibacter halophilus]